MNTDQTSVLVKMLNEFGISTASSLQPNRSKYFLQYVLIVVDLSCPKIEEFLVEANAQGYFKSPYRWLMINSGKASKILEKLDPLVDSDVVIASEVGYGFLFTEAYKIATNSNIIYNKRCFWTEHNHDEYFTNGNVYTSNSTVITNNKELDSKTNKSKISMKIDKYGVTEDYRKSKVLSTRRSDLKRNPLTMVNMSYAVVKICFEMLNATEKLMFTHTWGYRDKNGNWQGVVDYLIKKEADLERMDVVDYIAMVGSTAVRFVFREPPLAYISNIFTLPFTGTVWMAILICVLGCSHPLQLDGTWADVLILIIGAVLQQGCNLEPRYAAAIYDKKIAPKGKKPNFYTMEEGVERIRQGLFAFHMELNPGYRLIQETYREDEKCDLVEIDYINEIDPWVPGQKRSPFNNLFKINFLKIRESGIQANIHHRLHVPKPRCSGTVSTFSSVGITDMYPAMLATLYGMMLAPAVLLLEITYKKLMIVRQNKKVSTENLYITPFVN
ncbi:hypothetical protein O3G_MSEX010159 [Manduca sexta]|uniref:Uncharacterized protein n=1 Tax=Manduca sexta TaxID=7130 RepID=A0A922CT55_MANSE|nr:hypothetical protein O3G_MSEX010159 [Manduca sexta]